MGGSVEGDLGPLSPEDLESSHRAVESTATVIEMGGALLVADDILVRRRLSDTPMGAVWFLHAFADSGLAFSEVMDSQLDLQFDLYAPDFPGFGDSPLQRDRTSLDGASEVMIELVDSVSPARELYLVAHSVASVVATRMAQHIGERVKGVFSIEGNLTAADAYFTGQAVEYNTGEEFKIQFLRQLHDLAADDIALMRYFSAASIAHPDALMGWGRSAVELGDVAGDEFAALKCPTLYYWSNADPPDYRRHFIDQAGLENRQYPGDSHWPMIDQPERCISDIAGFFTGLAGTQPAVVE